MRNLSVSKLYPRFFALFRIFRIAFLFTPIFFLISVYFCSFVPGRIWKRFRVMALRVISICCDFGMSKDTGNSEDGEGPRRGGGGGEGGSVATTIKGSGEG